MSILPTSVCRCFPGEAIDDYSPSQMSTLEQQMEIAIKQSTSVPTVTSSTVSENLLSSIKAEMAVFETSGKRGRCLETVYNNYLLTIPPTSVEAERAFSSAGLLCTKLRSCLDDATVDTLCFLRSHYHDNN